jgi:hypothetical protein
MKVTPSQQPQPQQARNAKPASPVGGQTLATEPAPVAGTRSFASVLDSASNSGEGLPEPERGKQLETAIQQPPAKGPEERKSLKSEDAELISIGASPVQLSSPIETTDLSAPLAPREILPAADLENIMITVRTEMVVGGQPQTTIDLPRSILEGLRVRLSTDRTGRISAEFVARTEAVKAQVDARASELVDMLRFRGLNLSALKTSVSTDLNGGNDSYRRNPNPGVEAPTAAGTVAAGDPASRSDVSRRESDSDDSFTYRA